MPAAAALSSGGTALELPGAMHERATLSKRRSISGAQRVKFLDQKSARSGTRNTGRVESQERAGVRAQRAWPRGGRAAAAVYCSGDS
eukprot:776001-Prymnesium_polylepis.1